MKDKVKVSVALAAYKGEAYLAEQLASVLPQLEPEDEVIISDDYPAGKTREVVKRFAERDSRIVYCEGEGKGVIRNFEHAIRRCTGDIIFLCDQDDVWLPDKVKTVKEAFASGAAVVLHDAKVTDDRLHVIHGSFFALQNTSLGYTKNIIRNHYIGCCMAFSKDILQYILPFPTDLPMHDQWIGLVGEKTGRNVLIHKPLILYRRHDGTVTGAKTTLSQKVKWRISIIRALRSRFGKRERHD